MQIKKDKEEYNTCCETLTTTSQTFSILIKIKIKGICCFTVKYTIPKLIPNEDFLIILRAIASINVNTFSSFKILSVIIFGSIGRIYFKAIPNTNNMKWCTRYKEEKRKSVSLFFKVKN